MKRLLSLALALVFLAGLTPALKADASGIGRYSYEIITYASIVRDAPIVEVVFPGAEERTRQVNPGAEISDLSLPNRIEVYIQHPRSHIGRANRVLNVTWSSSPAFDGDTSGVYVFTPTITDRFHTNGVDKDYVWGVGVSPPAITVTVTPEGEIVSFLPLGGNVRHQTAAYSADVSDLNLPEMLEVTFRDTSDEYGPSTWPGMVDATWKAAPAFNGLSPGEYTFTAEIGSEFVLASGVQPPTINVTVTGTSTYDITGKTAAEALAEINALLTSLVGISGPKTLTVTGSNTFSVSSFQLNVEVGTTLVWTANTQNTSLSLSDGGTFKLANGGRVRDIAGNTGINIIISGGTTGGISSDGNITINGGSITGGPPLIRSSGRLTVNGGTVTSTSAVRPNSSSPFTPIGVIIDSTGSFTINGGEFHGEVIGNRNNDTTINGGTFRGSTTAQNIRGGAFFGGQVRSSTASFNLYVFARHVSGGTFSRHENTSGGTIQVNIQNGTLTGGDFRSSPTVTLHNSTARGITVNANLTAASNSVISGVTAAGFTIGNATASGITTEGDVVVNGNATVSGVTARGLSVNGGTVSVSGAALSGNLSITSPSTGRRVTVSGVSCERATLGTGIGGGTISAGGITARSQLSKRFPGQQFAATYYHSYIPPHEYGPGLDEKLWSSSLQIPFFYTAIGGSFSGVIDYALGVSAFSVDSGAGSRGSSAGLTVVPATASAVWEIENGVPVIQYQNGGETFSAEMGESFVFDFSPGDLDGDGIVDTTDVMLLRRFLWHMDNGGTVENFMLQNPRFRTYNADVNGDGYICFQDVILLRQYIAGFDVVLGAP